MLILLIHILWKIKNRGGEEFHANNYMYYLDINVERKDVSCMKRYFVHVLFYTQTQSRAMVKYFAINRNSF